MLELTVIGFLALQVLIAVVYSFFVEYFAHIALHKLGKSAKSIFAFHLRDHHACSKKQGMIDQPSGREALWTGLLLLAHAPLAWWFPLFYATLIGCTVHYLAVHWYAHVDPEWCQRRLPWHYNHHMKYPNHNWGVRTNLLDRLFGTYK